MAEGMTGPGPDTYAPGLPAAHLMDRSDPPAAGRRGGRHDRPAEGHRRLDAWLARRQLDGQNLAAYLAELHNSGPGPGPRLVDRRRGLLPARLLRPPELGRRTNVAGPRGRLRNGGTSTRCAEVWVGEPLASGALQSTCAIC